MITEEENRLICEVEGLAPMGQLMRRHWIPALMSEEIETDGKPVRVRLFGEDLVAFRDSNGDVGLIDEFCPHRGPSLYFGRNENCGLRCLYHGWKFDKDGNITEMPSEPPESQMKERIKIKAYSTHEAGGFVWAWMGPADEMPAFQAPPFAPDADTKVSITKIPLSDKLFLMDKKMLFRSSMLAITLLAIINSNLPYFLFIFLLNFKL